MDGCIDGGVGVFFCLSVEALGEATVPKVWRIGWAFFCTEEGPDFCVIYECTDHGTCFGGMSSRV